MVNGFHDLGYGERLRVLGLFSLKYRRLRGDLIEVYKILNSLDVVNLNGALTRQPRLRGNQNNLRKDRCRTRSRLMSFSMRVVNHWNELPDEIIASPTLGCFKTRLDKYYEASGVVYSF